jgi:uncharacterized protein YcfL
MNLRHALTPLVLAATLLAGGAYAQSIASKVEHQGDSRYVQVAALMARERNGLLNLQIELMNTDNEPRRVFWRIKWLDDAGFQVWDDEAWKPLLVQGSARQNVLVSAPTTKARDFRIQFNAENNWANSPGSSNVPTGSNP